MSEPDLRQTYAFSCTGCGHAWKQSYDIVLVTGPDGRRSQTYRLDGRTVPSPLTSPVCPHCESRRVHAVPVGLADRALAAETAAVSRAERAGHTPHQPHGPHLHLRRRSHRTGAQEAAPVRDRPLQDGSDVKGEPPER
ncbi:hypothetical protein C3486_00800 [Streptomyces sp. Ru73]|uniref:hypothetical protein n=1 Tax=Streptomyces sp. Ru73 TaxID=2080748 RepID=UPI000CDCEA44|nr:hypothetical protein [Streptomyces sp. Ru73]POX43495.1 hypothetical protein C3486_00800 [Streptomyces sp. Ru73]